MELTDRSNRMPDVSIVIIHYKMSGHLLKCLDSIYKQNFSCNFEVLVVNKASGDNVEKEISHRFPQVRIINHDKFGISRSRNIGVANSNGRYVLLLDADTRVLPKSLDRLVKFADSHPQAAAVGAKLISTDGTFQHSCRRFSSPLIAILRRGSFIKKILPNSEAIIKKYLLSDWDHNSTLEVDYVIGACLLIRREVMERVGLFDEHFYFGAEDEDWCYRAKRLGWKVYYVSDAVIIHEYRRKSDEKFNRLALEHLRSGVYMFAKRYINNLLNNLL